MSDEDKLARYKRMLDDSDIDQSEYEALVARLTAASAAVEGSGAVALGDQAKATGERGVMVENGNTGNINTGTQVDARGSQGFINKAGGQISQHFGDNIVNPPPKDPADEAFNRYLRKLRQECTYLPLATLGGQEDVGQEVTLDQVYIALDTEEIVATTEDDRLAMPAEELLQRGRNDRRALSAIEVVSQHSRVAVLGGPGSGKSSFVNQLAAELASARLGEPHRLQDAPDDLLARTPLRITLRELAPRLTELKLDGLSERKRDEHFVAAVWDQWRADLKKYRAEACETRLDDHLNDGQGLLIFDGLDEVPFATRILVRQAVMAVLRRYPDARALVTCRSRSYPSSRFEGFKECTLAKLDEDKIRTFVKAWYDAHVHLGRMQPAAAEVRIENLTNAALGDYRDLAQESPLLLTVMAIVHHSNVELPREQVKLYDAGVKVLLNHWHRSKDLALHPDVAALLKDEPRLNAVIESIAYETHRVQSRAKDAEALLPRGELITLLEHPELLGDAYSISAFLDFVDQTSGLMIGQGGDVASQTKPVAYGFPHRAFQEYLAGRRMVWGNTRQRREMYLRHAGEGDYWSVAARYGGEALNYLSTTRDSSLLELLQALCPADEPDSTAKWRATLWAGQMAALAGRDAVARFAEQEDDRGLLDRRLIPRLLEIMRGDRLPAIERAEAGKALAQLDDPRFAPGFYFLPKDDLLGFVKIPEGSFSMGTREQDIPRLIERLGGNEDYYRGEMPQHSVSLPEYYMARWPVTVAQYRAFAGEAGREWREQWNRFDNHPVVDVTWHDAMAYCGWLTEKLKANPRTPLPLRKMLNAGGCVTLPSEAEWETAARGGSVSAFPWGDDPDPNRANYADTGIRDTNAVGCFPNANCSYGCEEMIGNVWEWTRSHYKPYLYRANDGCENLKAGDGVARVVRGGSWFNQRYSARCAARIRGQPGYRSYLNGFRAVVRSAPVP